MKLNALKIIDFISTRNTNMELYRALAIWRSHKQFMARRDIKLIRFLRNKELVYR